MDFDVFSALRLPRVRVTIYDEDPSGEVWDLYRHFTKRHPKLWLVQTKSVGVMLCPIPPTPTEYESRISGKNGVAYFSRRCRKLGYTSGYFVQAEHLDELFAINSSSVERQGRRMPASYLRPRAPEPEKECVRYFGVFDSPGSLVAYVRLIMTRSLVVVGSILGHSSHLDNNVMHLLMHDLMVDLIAVSTGDRLMMYDMYYGASEGLRLFKKRHTFEPYRVKWKYQKVNIEQSERPTLQ